LNFKGGRAKGINFIRSQRTTKYTPSFTAGAYGIFGKSTKFGIISGLGIRPVQLKKKKLLPELTIKI